MANAVANEGQLPKIIAWMDALGLPARNSRYARYEGHINKFFRDGLNPLSEEGKQFFQGTDSGLSRIHRHLSCLQVL